MSALGDLIRRCMASADFNQADLARRSGLSVQQINQWCNDSRPMRRFPDPPTILALAKGLGVTADMVLNACADDVGLNMHREQLDPERALLIATAEEVPDDEIPRVTRLLRAYLRDNGA